MGGRGASFKTTFSGFPLQQEGTFSLIFFFPFKKGLNAIGEISAVAGAVHVGFLQIGIHAWHQLSSLRFFNFIFTFFFFSISFGCRFLCYTHTHTSQSLQFLKLLDNVLSRDTVFHFQCCVACFSRWIIIFALYLRKKGGIIIKENCQIYSSSQFLM